MQLDMSKLHQVFEKGEETEQVKIMDCFLEVVLSDSISIKELREKGYTPEQLLKISSDSMDLVEELDRIDESMKNFSWRLLNAPAIKGARKLF